MSHSQSVATEGRDRSGDLDHIATWLEGLAKCPYITDPLLHDTDGPDGDCLDDCGGCRSYAAVASLAAQAWQRCFDAFIARSRPGSDKAVPKNPYRTR